MKSHSSSMMELPCSTPQQLPPSTQSLGLQQPKPDSRQEAS